MRKILMAGAAAISLTIMPAMAIAQASVPGSTNSVDDKRPADMTEDQQAMYDTWPADQQADYNTWPGEYQIYYWGLEPEYQQGYWALTPEQRTRIYDMAPDQQAAAWKSVVAQLNGDSTPASTSSASSSATASGMSSSSSGNTRFISNEMVQGGMTTPSAQADYPVCKGSVQDS